MRYRYRGGEGEKAQALSHIAFKKLSFESSLDLSFPSVVHTCAFIKGTRLSYYSFSICRYLLACTYSDVFVLCNSEPAILNQQTEILNANILSAFLSWKTVFWPYSGYCSESVKCSLLNILEGTHIWYEQ